MKKLALKDVKLKIYAPPERKVNFSSPSCEVIITDLTRKVFDMDRRVDLGWSQYVQKGEPSSVLLDTL